MKYPTMDEVNAADQQQLALWYRFLPSPGTAYIGTREFPEALAIEVVIMSRIMKRFKGFTPALSKAIGWEVN